jgi:large subunit ribosomal protein L15
MKINELAPAAGSKHKKKRVGRGPGSGHGKTACRGHNGQKSRSGGGPARGFEGGQMPIHRRLPKRGFTNPFKKNYNILNVKDLEQFGANSILDSASFMEAGLIKKMGDRVKLLGQGEISHPLTIKLHKVSRSAREKIESAGGTVEIL